MSVILSGVRVAIVISVGAWPPSRRRLAPVVWVSSSFAGLAMVDNRVILAGAIPAAILALAADLGVGWLERRLRAG